MTSSNEHPDMSGSGVDDNYFSSEQVSELRDEAFIAGAQQMREKLAQCLESQPAHHNPDPKAIAEIMRAVWVPGWGTDPGKPDQVHNAIDAALP